MQRFGRLDRTNGAGVRASTLSKTAREWKQSTRFCISYFIDRAALRVVEVASAREPREPRRMESNHLRIADMPVDERPRERMARGGVAALSDAELVALLIEPGYRGRSSLDIGREIVRDGLLAFARKEWI